MFTRGRKRLSEVSETTAADEDAPSPKKTKLAHSQVATGAADVSEPEQRVARQPVYTVKICDEVFRLGQSQILFEDPSYFSMAFSDDWIEGETRIVEILDRCPTLFRQYIRPWLSGYDLDYDAIAASPSTLSNLKKDADFYQLSRFKSKLESIGKQHPSNQIYLNAKPNKQTVTSFVDGQHVKARLETWTVTLRDVVFSLDIAPYKDSDSDDDDDDADIDDSEGELRKDVAFQISGLEVTQRWKLEGLLGGHLDMDNKIRPMLSHVFPKSIEFQIDDLSGTQRCNALQLRDATLSVLNIPNGPYDLRNGGPTLGPLLDLLDYQPDMRFRRDRREPFKLLTKMGFVGKEVTVLLVKYAGQEEEDPPTLRIHTILRAHLETKALHVGRHLAQVAKDSPPLL